MIVVSDTTPIISLIRVDKLNLLEKLFDTIVIPEKVFEELTLNPEYGREAELVRKTSFLEIVPVTNQKAVAILMKATNLDIGESEAIVLSEELAADVILMDEKKGRRISASIGLEIMGTVGVLINALAEGFITPSEAVECLDTMRKSGIRINDALYSKAILNLMNI
ncbi:MAG: DUF3368 domain-containing protein [Turicibacter sp.]|nr:DUF3368 domain-containing protein [Turicibacter sp.]